MGGTINKPMDCTTWKYFRRLTLPGFPRSFSVGILIIESRPKTGIATITDNTINARKQTIITNAENKSWENGFIPRNAEKAMSIYLQAKIIV